MRHKILLCLAVLFLSMPSAFAVEAIKTKIPDASVVGSGVLTVAFWDVYTVTLYAPKGRLDFAKPFALSIEYLREIDGKDIADRSVQEMRKQGFADEIKLAAWNTQLKEIFPNVKNGTTLSAVYIPGKQTIFYEGKKPIGTIKNNDFGKLFFGIWLDEKTSEPELRRALLGLS